MTECFVASFDGDFSENKAGSNDFVIIDLGLQINNQETVNKKELKWKPVVDFFLYNVGKIAVEPKHTEYNYCKLVKTELILEPKTERANRKTPM